MPQCTGRRRFRNSFRSGSRSHRGSEPYTQHVRQSGLGLGVHHERVIHNRCRCCYFCRRLGLPDGPHGWWRRRRRRRRLGLPHHQAALLLGDRRRALLRLQLQLETVLLLQL